MGTKVTVTPLAADYASKQILNTNFAVFSDAFDNTLSLDGTSPNQMEADLDLNGNRIINLPLPTLPTDVVRLQDLATFDGGGAITPYIQLPPIAAPAPPSSGWRIYVDSGSTPPNKLSAIASTGTIVRLGTP